MARHARTENNLIDAQVDAMRHLDEALENIVVRSGFKVTLAFDDRGHYATLSVEAPLAPLITVDFSDGCIYKLTSHTERYHMYASDIIQPGMVDRMLNWIYVVINCAGQPEDIGDLEPYIDVPRIVGVEIDTKL